MISIFQAEIASILKPEAELKDGVTCKRKSMYLQRLQYCKRDEFKPIQYSLNYCTMNAQSFFPFPWIIRNTTPYLFTNIHASLSFILHKSKCGSFIFFRHQTLIKTFYIINILLIWSKNIPTRFSTNGLNFDLISNWNVQT